MIKKNIVKALAVGAFFTASLMVNISLAEETKEQEKQQLSENKNTEEVKVVKKFGNGKEGDKFFSILTPNKELYTIQVNDDLFASLEVGYKVIVSVEKDIKGDYEKIDLISD